MKRRSFITLLGGTAAWPLAAPAQQPARPVIGFLHPSSPAPAAPFVTGFRQGLKESGYVEGQNVAIEYRWAESQIDRLPALAADLVRRNVTVIAATGGSPSVLAAKAATSTIPIAFLTSEDPTRLGLVASFNRPGGNATGVSLFTVSLGPKCLELLGELVPNLAVVALLLNPSDPNADSERQGMQAAANKLGKQLVVVTAGSEGDIERAFATLAEKQADGLVVSPNALFTNRRDQVVALAARHALPTISQWREHAAAGGLMTYGTNLADAFRQVGVYASRILKGEKPADLPVQQPIKFELVINLKTAKALGLEVPPKLLALADEVIE